MAKGGFPKGGMMGVGMNRQQAQMQQKLLYVDLQRWRQQ